MASETDSSGASRIAYQSMFEHVSLGIIVVDDQGLIKQVNPYACRLFGYSDRELIGQKIEVLIPMPLRHRHIDYRNHYNEKPKARAMGLGMDLRAVRKDGSEFPVEISLSFYQVDSKKEVVSFISDITGRKKAEEALRRLNAELEDKVEERTKELSQALLELHHINEDLTKGMEQRRRMEEELRLALDKEKELGELKSRFVSMASHEFRTPLAGILTSASLIERYRAPEDEAKRAKHLNTIKTSVKNLTSILNDFLSLDKLEGGKIECRPSRFRLLEWMQELLQELQGIAKKGQEIDFACEGQGDEVCLDSGMLRNILINLISNATKYSPEGSKIDLRLFLEPDRLSLEVQDQGIGIPKEDQRHLFGKFFRAANTNAIQGTGLGLNIIRRYLELMQGSIDFQSEEGEGSLFTVRLPKELKP